MPSKGPSRPCVARTCRFYRCPPSLSRNRPPRFQTRRRFYISASAPTRDPHRIRPVPTPMPHTVSQLEQTLRARRFAITTELTPPVSFDPDDLLHKARPLKGLADAVNVTDGASARAHMSALAAAALLAQEGIEPILQLTCRDRNRIALQADLMGAAALGIHNLLLLTGDDPTAGDQPDTKPVFDVDSTALTAMARLMHDQGELPTGRKIGGQASFFLGTADMPIDPPPGWKPTKLAGKIKAG